MQPSILVGCLVLDLAAGDPEWFSLHPVRLMGHATTRLERLARRASKGPAGEMVSGAIITALLAGGTYALTNAILKMAGQTDRRAGFALEIFLGWTSLALGNLLHEASAVLDAAKANDLPLARLRLARIVGRDTAALEIEEIARATIETLAESTCDGVIAPLFYLCLGGPALALAFKAVSTLDSMIGHRDLPYLYLGRVAARADDVANYLPARISAAMITLCSALLPGANANAALRIWRRDGNSHASPNAGQLEAAMAGALQVRLGGMNTYGGEPQAMPLLGAEFPRPQMRDARRCLKITLGASLLAFAVATLFSVWAHES